MRRAYYYCGRCKPSFLPYDDALGLVDEISPGLMPLLCLAGTLRPFADAAGDLLKRLARRALVGLDGPAGHGRGGRASAGAAAGGADGRADAGGAAGDRAARPRPTGGVRGPGRLQRADARGRGGPGRASHAVHRLARTRPRRSTPAPWWILNSTPWRSKSGRRRGRWASRG